jgi:CheY-like chemotaxis protein
MIKVLVVDDERDYCEHLSLCLASEGCLVRTATTGSEAIEVGARYRPDVLIADYILQNHVHGLHVAETLRTVHPSLRTILITGFGTRDVQKDARDTPVLDYIEKPFEPSRIQQAVRSAAAGAAPPCPPPSVAVLEVDADGTIVFANPCAREMFAQVAPGEVVSTLSDLFDPDELARLTAALGHWVRVRPRALGGPAWHGRTRVWSDGSGRMCVLAAWESGHVRHLPVTHRLLGLAEVGYPRWTLPGHVLVVDDEEASRRAIVAQLQRVGAVCHSAADHDEGLRLASRDPRIGFVVLDYHIPSGEMSAFVQQLSGVRAEVLIIGTSGGDRREAFAAVGVTRFLQKPWRAEDLLDLLRDRIGSCVECGLPLPLRRPLEGEPARSWVCCGCGARYYGVLDEEVHAETLRNVRPAG